MFGPMILLSDAAAPAANQGGSALDKILLGLGVAGLGMAVVFFGLISLIVITILYPKLAVFLIAKSTARKERKKARKALRLTAMSEAKPAEAAVQKKNAEDAKAADTSGTQSINDPALIAVITAAVAASLGTTSNGIVIKSLRRTGSNVPAWGTSGRSEQIFNRL